MSEREDILIGFQIIKKVNLGNTVTENAAAYMKKEMPVSGEPLVVWTNEDEPKVKETEVADIKELTTTTGKIIELEVETRLEKFLENYPDKGAVARGLQHFNIRRQDVNRDVSEVKLHKESVQNVNTLVHDFQGLKANGELLALYTEAVELHVDIKIHRSQEHVMLTAYQDVLNAIGLELQGLNSYTGAMQYWDYEDRLAIVQARLRVAKKIGRALADTPETRGFEAARRYIQNHLPDTVHIHDLDALAAYLNTQVPQLPLLRRWWNFN